MSESFLDLVDQLTKPHPVTLERDSGVGLKMRRLSGLSGRIGTAPNRVRKHSPGPNPQIGTSDWRAAMQSIRWKAIPGYEGLYEVSDTGAVRSLDREVPFRNSTRTFRGKLLKQRINPDGYPILGLSKEGAVHTVSVHRLVLLAFVGEPGVGQEACHSNGDPSDNRAANLRWDSHSLNMQDAIDQGTHFMARKTHCKRGHEFTEANTYRMVSGGRACRECAASYKRPGGISA